MKKPWFKAAGSGERSSGVHYVMDLALRGKAGDQCGPQQGTEDVISDFDLWLAHSRPEKMPEFALGRRWFMAPA